jgi:hypothetical protein
MNKRRLFSIMLLAFMSVNMIGCVVNEDGTTNTDPNAADKLEAGGEAALDIAEIVAPFVGPAGGIVVGGIATALSLFKKYKPKLVEQETKAQKANTVAGITVDVFETLKKEHPNVWKECASKLHDGCASANIDTQVLENFIRGLRGLPAKGVAPPDTKTG